MTLAELMIAIFVVGLFYFLMTPLQRRLESRFYKFFHSKSRRAGKPVIDITDYSNKGKKP